MSFESEMRMHEPIRESDEAKIARLESALRAHKVTIEVLEDALEEHGIAVEDIDFGADPHLGCQNWPVCDTEGCGGGK